MILFKKSVFIITKPLQYINATNIIDGNYKIGILTDTFQNAEEVFEKLQSASNHWDEFIFLKSGEEANRWVLKNRKSIEKLYTYSDYGLSNFIFLNRLGNISKYIYEEGLGNYILGLRKKNLLNRIVGYFYELLGNQEFVGGSRYIDGLFVYHPKKILQNFPKIYAPVFDFGKPFLQHLRELPESVAFYNDKDRDKIKSIPPRQNVLLYLGTWFHDMTEEDMFRTKNVIDTVNRYDDYIKIYKPHPHSGLPSPMVEQFFDDVITGGTMAELILTDLLNSAQHIVAVHHGSSALIDFEHSDRITVIDLGLD